MTFSSRGLVVLFLFTLFFGTTAALAQKSSASTANAVMGIPAPIIVPGTPTCADLNASLDPAFSHITEDWGFRISRSAAIPFAETFPFLNGPETMLMGGAAQSPTSRIRLAAGGNTLSWLSNRPITAVIVQSELLGANVYPYNPPSSGGFDNGEGRGLTSPGGCATITGVTFCFESLEPTAAPANVTGRVTTASGVGISGARLVLTSAQYGTTWTAVSNPLGYFSIESVPVGSFYVLSVSHRSYSFENPSRSFSLNGDLEGADFVANP